MGPEVKSRVWKEIKAGDPYPSLYKEYSTPGGILSQRVRQTVDWPHGDDIPIFTDFCVPRPRSLKYLLESEKDLDALPYLFPDPSDQERAAFVSEARDIKQFAEDREILVLCGGYGFAPLFGVDALAWLCGIENLLLSAYDSPNFLHRLLEIVLNWNSKYIAALAEVGGVDVIAHRGYYESTQFWSPQLYREFIAPVVQKEIELVHGAGAKFCYIMVEGALPLLGTLKELGVDILFGIDPVERGMDLEFIKREGGSDICLWGGVSEHVTLESMDKRRIEDEVREAIRTLAPGGGFILSAVDNRPTLLWDSTIKLIQAWRKYRDDPSLVKKKPKM
jgi:uroporphyrinogen decarboxylase